jgi:hypothetical protein
MTPVVDKKDLDGVCCYVCRQCGETLIRIEPNGILGGSLSDLDAIAISDHYFTYHK